MRRLLVALIATLLVLSIKVIAEDEIINFPDPYFKKILVKMIDYEQPEIDLNRDGEIQYSEAAAYDGLLWLSVGGDSVSDLTGIKAFINTKKIWLERRTYIKEIDFSGMVNLQEIDLNNIYNLELLNISGCNNLDLLDCEDNKLRYLNAKNCFKLSTILCLNNAMENIDLTECRNLQTLVSTKGNLKELNIKDCLKLDGIICSFNKLTDLDLSHLKYLTGLTCDNNLLIKIDLSNSPQFIRLKAFSNQLEFINIRNGNNNIVTTFQTNGNPSLKCITVDDPAYSKENWKDIDEWTKFSEDCSTSINDNPQNTFKVFPNPANHTVFIERTTIEPEDLRILDIRGKIYVGYTIPFGETQTRLDISWLSAGKYIIEINNETSSLIVE